MTTYRNHLALGGHVGGAVAESQASLEGVEGGLQLGLLLQLGWLVTLAVVTELLQLLLCAGQRVVCRPVLQPRRGATDPLQQLQERDRDMTTLCG